MLRGRVAALTYGGSKSVERFVELPLYDAAFAVQWEMSGEVMSEDREALEKLFEELLAI
jgi:hypothetical protein